MESLNLIDGISFTHDNSGLNLYWSRYRYRLIVDFKCINRVRYYRTTDHFLNSLDSYRPVYWGKPYQHTLRDLIEDAGGSVADLCKFIEYRGSASTEVKLLTTHNTVNFYFNELPDATYFINLFNKGDGCRGYYRIKNSMVESGVIYLQKPHGTHRLYFKFTRVFDQTIADLCKFIDEYSATPCYTLRTGICVWKNSQSHAFTLNSGNFIDVPSEQVATIFALKFNSMLSKISPIKDRKMINNINSEFPDGTNI